MADSEKTRKKVVQHRKPLQDRAIQTRADLLDAARRVFARDGFETARLEDIARAAGKTRGALYTHFRDKEDLFFALIEQDMERDAEVYRRLLGNGSTFERRVEVLTQQLTELIENRKRMLLYVEFKMYVLRHPRKQKRLVELHYAVCLQGSTHKLALFPEMRDSTEAQRRRTGAIFGALLDGLAISRYFDPAGMTDDEVRRRVARVVRERLTELAAETTPVAA